MGRYETRYRFWMIITVILAVGNHLDGPVDDLILTWWCAFAMAVVNGGLSLYHKEP